MAQLDRFLAVMVANRADSIVLAEGNVATLQKDGAPRPITRQPLSAQQLLMLLREIAPPAVAQELAVGSAAEFSYANDEGAFAVEATQAGGRWQASIVAARHARRADDATVESAAATRPETAGNGNGDRPRAARDGESVAAQNGTAPEGVAADVALDPPTASSAAAVGVRLAGAHSPEERAEAARADMDDLLRLLVEKGASDLHLRCGETPIMRLHGEMVRLEGRPPIDDDGLEAMLRAIMHPRTRQEFADSNDADFAYELDGLARFRCNAFRERRGAAGVFRVIPSEVVTVEQLGRVAGSAESLLSEQGIGIGDWTHGVRQVDHAVCPH